MRRLLYIETVSYTHLRRDRPINRIEGKVLNCQAVAEAEKNMVFAARLDVYKRQGGKGQHLIAACHRDVRFHNRTLRHSGKPGRISAVILPAKTPGRGRLFHRFTCA